MDCGWCTVKWDLKYRPRTFEDVRGQPEKAHIRLALKNKSTFPPLLLFQGPSGTGKTTMARVLAAALNCSDLGPKSDPCTKCNSCVAIFNHEFAGVYEHNAAFRNGAEDMRELQQRSNMYSDGDFNVFILDEAQALSSQAWKVLLKLFEEPPAGNVFILVTSEPNKIPTTMQTRAISYEFGRVAPLEVRRQLEIIQVQENLTVEGLDTIVDLADGSVRQAVKMMEQCARSGKSAYDIFDNRDHSLYVWEAAAANDSSAGLEAIEQMWNSVGDPQAVMEQLANQLQRVQRKWYKLALYTSSKTEERLEMVSSTLGEKRISLAFEIMAEWYPRSKSKAHLLFTWSSLLKALHGPTKIAPSPIVRPVSNGPSPKTLPTPSVKAALKGLRFE